MIILARIINYSITSKKYSSNRFQKPVYSENRAHYFPQMDKLYCILTVQTRIDFFNLKKSHVVHYKS